MNLAIILAGPYRGNQSIIQSHYDFIGMYDTYVSCLEHYKKDWENSNWQLTKIFETPSIDIKSTNWFQYRNDAPGQSGFWQFWNLRNVIKSVPKEYDFYIKSRCDLRIESNLNIDFQSLNDRTLYTSAHSFHKGIWGGDWINDEFYIGSGYVMDIVANFVTEYYESNQHPINEPIASNEMGLLSFLKQKNISVDKIQNLKYSKDNNGINIPSGYVAFQLEEI